MWSARDIRMNRDGKDELIVLPVEVVEVVPPQILCISCIDEPVTVGRLLDEHVRRQIIQIPVRRNLNQTCILSLDQRFHPLLGFLAVVDLGPCVVGPQVISLAVVVAHTVVVLDSVRQQ